MAAPPESRQGAGDVSRQVTSFAARTAPGEPPTSCVPQCALTQTEPHLEKQQGISSEDGSDWFRQGAGLRGPGGRLAEEAVTQPCLHMEALREVLRKANALEGEPYLGSSQGLRLPSENGRDGDWRRGKLRPCASIRSTQPHPAAGHTGWPD